MAFSKYIFSRFIGNTKHRAILENNYVSLEKQKNLFFNKGMSVNVESIANL